MKESGDLHVLPHWGTWGALPCKDDGGCGCARDPRIAGPPEVRRKGWDRFSSKPLGGTNLRTP